jgi:hypothetical protein
MTFLEELKMQRWDDHRYYHHSRINQSLHLFSALSFLATYILIPFNPVAAALLGWIVAMWSRQIGHFFFEPKCYDEVNKATHEHKENIKVGYNLRRKVVLLLIWATTPMIIHYDRSLLGLFEIREGWYGFIHNLSILWLLLGAIAVMFRTIHLFFIMSIQSGLVWATKILTDPFHDIKLYHKSPIQVLRGELIDPMASVS